MPPTPTNIQEFGATSCDWELGVVVPALLTCAVLEVKTSTVQHGWHAVQLVMLMFSVSSALTLGLSVCAMTTKSTQLEVQSAAQVPTHVPIHAV